MPFEIEETFTLGILLDTVTELCKERGITIKNLEKELKFGNGTIRRWNTSKPAISAVVKVACYFGVSVDYLLGLSRYRQNETRYLTVDKIGLSEVAATRLLELVQSDEEISHNKIKVLNLMLEDDGVEEWGAYFLQSLSNYICLTPMPDQLIAFPSGDFERTSVLYDQVLKNRILRASEDLRHHFHNGSSKMPEMCIPINEDIFKGKGEEESDNGKLQTDN